MGKDRFVNRKLAKKRGFAERQETGRVQVSGAKQSAGRPAVNTIGQRAIIAKSGSRRTSGAHVE
jgi:hypothetical protein